MLTSIKCLSTPSRVGRIDTAGTALRVFAYPRAQPTGVVYYPGETVKYDGYIRRGNYIYISYVNYAGYHHYITVRQNGVVLGIFR